ncbi:MAG: hypothetical protein HFJ38_08695, partial [Bacilli bacterium]|nr:hypothetical protein [Bacilli bacterium]
TNIEGEVSIKGLKIGAEYTLEEVKADGYYLANPIKFVIQNNNGNYEARIIEGTVKEINTTKQDEIPTTSLKLENEKIPTYNIMLNKKAKGEETALQGAKFKLYKDNKEIGTYETNEAGQVEIEGLYQYVEEKGIDQTYILKEVMAPVGYAKVKDITFYAEKVEGLLNLQIKEGKAKDIEVEENTINITIEDNPSFKLIKKDGKTNELLPGVKFAIYNEETGKPATNSKGEIIGKKEEIDGQVYYTVITNEKGEITADLAEGMYKAVEIEADEKYELGSVNDRTKYFGIGASREAKYDWKVVEAEQIGGSSSDQISSVAETADGGYIAGGHFYGSITLSNGETLTGRGNKDGIIIKYNREGQIEWTEQIGGSSEDSISSVAETADGGYI